MEIKVTLHKPTVALAFLAVIVATTLFTIAAHIKIDKGGDGNGNQSYYISSSDK